MSTQEGTLPKQNAPVEGNSAKDGHVKLSWREKICYGFGDFGNGFMFDLGQAYLTKYWIDVCTIPAAAVAGILRLYQNLRRLYGSHCRFRYRRPKEYRSSR